MSSTINGVPASSYDAEGIAKQYVAFHTDSGTDPVLTDDEIAFLVRQHRCANVDGIKVTIITDPDWVPEYDLFQAVVDGWQKKAAKAAGGYLFITEGLSIHRQQIQAQCLAMAKEWKAKCMGTIQISSPAMEQGLKDWSRFTIITSTGELINNYVYDDGFVKNEEWIP